MSRHLKQIATLCAGLAAGGGTVRGVDTYIARNAAPPLSVAEVRRMIQTESPYVEDRRAIRDALDSLDAIQGDIRAVRENQARILTTLALIHGAAASDPGHI